MFTYKDLNGVSFPRMLHKDGVEQLVLVRDEAVALILAGWTLRPGEPVPGVADAQTPAAPPAEKPPETHKRKK